MGNYPDRFDPLTFSERDRFTCIGSGSIGAKAHNLEIARDVVLDRVAPLFTPAFHTEIPLLTVVTTELFDEFMATNALSEAAISSHTDEEIAQRFQLGRLPDRLTHDLKAFVERVRVPLAVRSSSSLETGMKEPFAGVYASRMLPNNAANANDRLRALAEAIKYVYASTFFTTARRCRKAAGCASRDERMAVIVQEVVGELRKERYYPQVSGVVRSVNFYPMGLASPDDGVVDLALGLGRMISVDRVAWSFSPAYPQANPPYTSLSDLIECSQKEFWAIDMSDRPEELHHDVLGHLRKYDLADAEADGTLDFIASTYSAQDDRLVRGISGSGPRLLDFAQVVRTDLVPFTPLIKDLLKKCEEQFGAKIELDFALTFPAASVSPARFGLLQVRPMALTHPQVVVSKEDLSAENAIVGSESVLGNGAIDSVRDIVVVKRPTLEMQTGNLVGPQLEEINRRMVAEGTFYVLIGFGRWGTTDSSAGVPVDFAQISAARALVEVTLPDYGCIPSQGSHLFHNVTRWGVLYFSVGDTGESRIDWQWLDSQVPIHDTDFVRHIRLAAPLKIKVDGHTRRGVILR